MSESKEPETSPAPASIPGPKAPVAIIRDQAVQSSWLENDTNTREASRKVALAEADAEAARIKRAQNTPEEGAYGLSHTADMGRPTTSPVVIVQMITADGRKEQFCQCDWTISNVDGAIQAALNLVCPRCVARNVPQAQAQIRISDANKRISLDTSLKGEIWVDPDDGQTYVLAGVVTLEEWSRCPRPGCGFRFRIDPRSNMRGVARLRTD